MRKSGDAGSYAATEDAASPPRALATRVEAVSSVEDMRFVLQQGGRTSAATKKLSIAFALRVGKNMYPAGSPNAGNFFTHALTVTFDAIACASSFDRQAELDFYPTNRFALAVKGLNDRCPDGGANDFAAEALPMNLSELVSPTVFTRMSLEIARARCDGGDGGSSVTARIEGRPRLCIDVSGDPLAHASKVEIAFGPYANGTFESMELVYDDITVDFD